jgi:hypothetical protein
MRAEVLGELSGQKRIPGHGGRPFFQVEVVFPWPEVGEVKGGTVMET